MKEHTLKEMDSINLERIKKLRSLTYSDVEDLLVYCSISKEPIPIIDKDNIPYHLIKKGNVWGKKVYDTAWMHLISKSVIDFTKDNYKIYMNIGGEGLIYTNDKIPFDIITNKVNLVDEYSLEEGKHVIDLNESIMKDNKVDFFMECGFNAQVSVLPFGIGIFHKASIVKENKAIKDYFSDFLAIVSLNIELKDEMIKNDIDKSYELVLDNKIDEARKILDKYINSNEPLDFDIYAIGHSHLDLAWLWPIRETKRKAVRTFTKQIDNIEKYPDYIYGASQPWQFLEIKKRDPILYEKIKKYVKEGRIELQGGMFVEADTNIPHGESLIRQIYYGKKVFNEEFNEEMKICWLPDVFGYNGNLPQILKKSDIDYFFTIKLSWNEHNKFPNRSFNWEGIDGSKVLVHMAPNESYCSDSTPNTTIFGYNNYPEKDVSNEYLYVYGEGDGGGGPSPIFIEELLRQQSMYKTPKVHFGKAIDFFNILDKKKDKLPTYKGELYLEKHQGTYTTQTWNKRYNRLSEYALMDIETLSSIAYLKGREYNHELINSWWKEILLYQFHDIIPGSCVNRVYKESRERYKTILSEIENEKKDILNYLSGTNNNLIAYNPTSFNRVEVIGDYLYDSKPYSMAIGKPYKDSNTLSIDNYSMKNEYLSVRFDKSGEIVSLKDNNGFEYSKEYINRINLYYDKRLYYNAWDIDLNYTKLKPKTIKAYKYKIKQESNRITRINYYRHGRSKLILEISLGALDKKLTIRAKANNHEKFKMLRSESLVNINSDYVSCDIQYGTLKRTTKDESSVEKAQFEICAHKYVDLSNDNRGLSLINSVKYGHRVKGNLISLNLLRSPVFPDPKADRGESIFDYAYYAHDGKLSNETLKEAYFFNKPLYLFNGDNPISNLIEIDNENVVIELIKKVENENSLILRLYESQGIKENAKIKLNFKYNDLFLTNLIERGEEHIENLSLSFTPFEIKTIKIKL